MAKVPHPFPYQGSKRNLASTIAQYLPNDISCFIEPFAGSAAMSLYVATHKKADNYIICDTNEPLIQLWEEIIQNPNKLCDKYEEIWQSQLNNHEEICYSNIRDQFNENHAPYHLLYLLSRCVKAAVRYNSQGDFNQSRDKRRLGMKPVTMRENINSVASLFRGRVEFYAQDYRRTLEMINLNDVVYMDPPYQGTSHTRDRRYINGLLHEEFMDFLKELNRRSISYLFSYDGRTDEKTYGQVLPLELELERIEIYAGKSSQATLLGRDEETYESLYLSPTLIQRLAKKIPPQSLQQPQLLHL